MTAPAIRDEFIRASDAFTWYQESDPMLRSTLVGAATAARAAVNDAFLAGVTGGMRRYHDKHHAPIDELRVTMPVSIRTEADSFANNRITLLRFSRCRWPTPSPRSGCGESPTATRPRTRRLSRPPT